MRAAIEDGALSPRAADGVGHRRECSMIAAVGFSGIRLRGCHLCARLPFAEL